MHSLVQMQMQRVCCHGQEQLACRALLLQNIESELMHILALTAVIATALGNISAIIASSLAPTAPVWLI